MSFSLMLFGLLSFGLMLFGIMSVYPRFITAGCCQDPEHAAYQQNPDFYT